MWCSRAWPARACMRSAARADPAPPAANPRGISLLNALFPSRLHPEHRRTTVGATGEQSARGARTCCRVQAEVCWAWTARSKGVLPGVIYGLALHAERRPWAPKAHARGRSPKPCFSGHLSGDELESSGRLQRLAASRRPRQCPRLPSCVREVSLDH